MTDLDRGLTELLAAAPAYVEAQNYYDADLDEFFTSPKLKRKLRAAGEMRINFAKTPVDAVINRLEVTAVTAALPGSQGTAAQDAVDAIWTTNQMDLELGDVLLKALIFGDAYLMLEGDAEVGLNLFYNSPLTTRVIYSEDNPREKAFAIKRWATGGLIRCNLLYTDRIERYVTKAKGSKGLVASDFVPYVGPDDAEDESVVENDYGFIPVYHFRTARPYGRPEHRDAYGPQKAINKLAITQLVTTDFQGFPFRYAIEELGKDTSDVDDFDEDFYHDPSRPESDGLGPHVWRGDREGESGVRADPGTIAMLRGVKSVGQFEAADPKTFIDPAEFYIKTMATTTTTPLHYFDPSGDVPSGESLRAADAPLVKKSRNRQLSFTGTLVEALEDALTILDLDGAKVSVQWASPDSTDDEDGWTVAAAKLEAGVPIRQVLSEMGYTTAQLDDWGVPEAKFSPPVTTAVADPVAETRRYE